MAGFVFRAILEIYIDAIAGFPGFDLNIRSGIAALALAVASDIERAYRKGIEFSDFF